LSVETATRDHKIPLTRGGSDYIENIALSCGPCNFRKHTKTDTEFRARLAA
jgi:5-methylcytosine-specific restriction endonuclease McrA